jgi:alcohol dehydrogenase
LITSVGWLKRGVLERLQLAGLNPVATLAEVNPNPRLADIELLATRLPEVDTVVALGGGSVIDAAKAALALQGLGLNRVPLISHLCEGTALPADMAPPRLIAVPTTAGTGSEVTRWGTVWGDDGIKYSVNDTRLYPVSAILDPGLLISMPRGLALATGLDALSHAMEAVWNRRHSALGDALATAAIERLFQHLAPSLAMPESLEQRRYIQTAAVLAGLAMGTTQTALAHSISYPFTSRFGMPHGIACSFTLAEIARYNLAADAERLRPIASALNCATGEIPDMIERWFEELGLAHEVARYVHPSMVDQLGDNLITRARAANNMREADGAAARRIVRAALDCFALHKV